MSVRLADQHKMTSLFHCLPAKGSPTVQIIAKQDTIMATDCFRVLFQPSFGRVDLTILLFMPILRTNELRLERNYMALFVVNDHRREDTVKTFCLSIAPFPMRTVLIMDLLKKKVFRPIDGDQQPTFSITILIEQLVCFHFMEHTRPCLTQCRRSNAIQKRADLVVTRYLLVQKQTLDI